jgi:hypothetical protein
MMRLPIFSDVLLSGDYLRTKHSIDVVERAKGLLGIILPIHAHWNAFHVAVRPCMLSVE